MRRDELVCLFDGLVQRCAAGLLLVDGAGTVHFANPMARELFGANLVGAALASRFVQSSQESCAAFLHELGLRESGAGPASFSGSVARADGYLTQLELRGVNAIGEPRLDGLILVVVDVTRWHNELLQLTRSAFHDSLTGLANRTLFADRLRQAIRGGGGGSVAMLDVNSFKQINDKYGHVTGDQLLVAIARRLTSALRPSDTLARLGGDEFGLILSGLSPDEARELIERTLASMAGPAGIDCGGEPLMMPTLSAGVTGFRGGVQETLRECDVALYATKGQGRNRVAVYGPEVRQSVLTRRDMADKISDLTEQNKKLKEKALTDALTRIPNRWTYEEIKDRVFGAPDCEWSQGAVLFVDVDWFGEYNKHYGDTPGDHALQQVAAALNQICRQSDVLFRKGGEEFAMVLPNVDIEMALAAAERIRRSVQTLGIPHVRSEFGVLTVTVGLSTAGPKDGKNVAQCLTEASDLVMAAKRNGQRNQLHCSPR